VFGARTRIQSGFGGDVGPVDLLRMTWAHLIWRHRIDQSDHEKSAISLDLAKPANVLAQAARIVLPWNDYHVSNRSCMALRAYPLPING